MSSKNKASYLGRPIDFVTTEDPSVLPSMFDATLLLWLGKEPSQEARFSLVRSIVRAGPLAVSIGGLGAEVLFEDLLRFLSKEETPRAMMTNFSESDLGEAVADFLQATWPYEERIDSWKAYRVACADGDHVSVQNAVAAALALGGS